MSNPINLLYYNLFKNQIGIAHGVSKRFGGNSIGSYNSLNLNFNAGDDPVSVQKNRGLLANKFGIGNSDLLFPDQCHTSNVICVKSNNDALTNSDALITNIRGLALGVLAADCVPVLFFDTKKKVIAAAHSGWRGTVQKIVLTVLQNMKSNYGSLPKGIIVGIGPCIQQNNYEVSSDVLLQVEKLGAEIYNCSVKASEKAEHAYINLQLINKLLIRDAGVPEPNIEVMNLCTYANPEIFFSARRDGFQSGRFGSVIMLK